MKTHQNQVRGSKNTEKKGEGGRKGRRGKAKHKHEEGPWATLPPPSSFSPSILRFSLLRFSPPTEDPAVNIYFII
jgi:hypothetical protein